ncbi:MAG: fibronectin type III-like domain-contianing protein [Clostridia bacterium]|nr:fibronectin type III-like domain-contianing protein [Clostridia bacterium]
MYCRQPDGKIAKPVRVLAGYAKTGVIDPGKTETVIIRFGLKYIASFDESTHSFVVEKGQYFFELQSDSLSAPDGGDTVKAGFAFVPAGSVNFSEDITVERCLPVCGSSESLKKRIEDTLPETAPYGLDKNIKFDDVAAGSASLDDFISQLSLEELEALTRGHGMMDSELGTPGNAGVIGGILPSLREKGVPVITCADGPAGLRLKKYCTLMPCGTAIAASWNEAAAETLHALIGKEMEKLGVDMQLSPGMNIHRNPLCGRNFEYFSEDPVLSGKTGAAVIRGVQSAGRSSCPKHFACNNQEKRRNTNDSRLSERALREIYLRNFEIAVKEGRPLAIMTSYNKVNGVWAHYSYDLATTVLRREWKYPGLVITDWWMRRSKSPEFKLIRDNAYRVRAGIDVLMPGNMSRVCRRYRSDGSLLKSLGKPAGITAGEIQLSARRVLETALALKKQE